MHGSLYRKVSVVSDYLQNVTSDLLHVNVPEYGTIVEDTCTLLHVNFEQQRCKVSVYTAASVLRCDCSENAFKVQKKKVLTMHGCLIDPRFTDHLPFKTVFAAPRGDC